MGMSKQYSSSALAEGQCFVYGLRLVRKRESNEMIIHA